MADQSLDLKLQATNPAGGMLYILIGGVDYYINYSDLVSSINSSISALQSFQNLAEQKTKYLSQSANFTHSLAANSKIIDIDIRHVSGTPTIKVGTTLGGSELISSHVILSGTDFNATIKKSFELAQTIYFTITGGTVSIVLTTKNTYF